METKKMQNKGAEIFFNIFADKFDTLYEKKHGPLMRILDYYFRSDIEIRFKRTFELFGNLKDRTVLDIGCGSGVYLEHALLNGAIKVTGVDPAPRMLEISNERLENESNEKKYELIQGAFPELDIEGKYDHIIIMGVMDYIDNPVVFLSALKHLLKKSAAISFPSYHWFRTPIRKFRYKMRNCPVYFYNEKKIGSLLISSGFPNYVIEKIPGAGMDYHVIVYP